MKFSSIVTRRMSQRYQQQSAQTNMKHSHSHTLTSGLAFQKLLQATDLQIEQASPAFAQSRCLQQKQESQRADEGRSLQIFNKQARALIALRKSAYFKS